MVKKGEARYHDTPIPGIVWQRRSIRRLRRTTPLRTTINDLAWWAVIERDFNCALDALPLRLFVMVFGNWKI